MLVRLETKLTLYLSAARGSANLGVVPSRLRAPAGSNQCTLQYVCMVVTGVSLQMCRQAERRTCLDPRLLLFCVLAPELKNVPAGGVRKRVCAQDCNAV